MRAKEDNPSKGMDAGQRRVHLHQTSGWLWLIGLPGCMAIGALVFVIKLQFGATFSAIFDLGLFFVLGIALEVKLYARLKRWQIALGREGTWMDRALRGRLHLLKIEAELEANPGLAKAVDKGGAYPHLKRLFRVARLAGGWGDWALFGVTAAIVLGQEVFELNWVFPLLGAVFLPFRVWLMQHAANHFANGQRSGISNGRIGRFDDLNDAEQAKVLNHAEQQLAGAFSLINPFTSARST